MAKPLRILSQVPSGSGAMVIHQLLAEGLPAYDIIAYHPWRTLLPFSLCTLRPAKNSTIIHAPPDYAFFLKKKHSPLVLTFHNYVLDAWMRPYSSLFQNLHYMTDLRLWTKLSLRRATCVTAVSYFIADLVRNDLNLDNHSIPVIYNGIDTEHFRPHAFSTGYRSRPVKVFFSGNLTRRKGRQWLPAIADRLDKDILIYYTSGLRQKNRLPPRPNLIPVGPVKFEDMPRQYQEMDILLMPTVREGFGLSVAEAMACQLPVVASDCSAIPELLDDPKGGFLCPVGDVESFAASINTLAASPRLRKEMGQYNRAAAEKRFSVSRMICEYKQLFEQLA